MSESSTATVAVHAACPHCEATFEMRVTVGAAIVEPEVIDAQLGDAVPAQEPENV